MHSINYGHQEKEFFNSLLEKVIPLLEAWRQRTEELKQAVQEMQQADLEGKTAVLTQAIQALHIAVTELPQAAREQFRGVRKELASGLGQALQQSWQEVMMPTFQQLNDHMETLSRGHTVLQEAIRQLPSTVATSLDERLRSSWMEAMEPLLQALNASQNQILEGLRAILRAVDRLPDTLQQALAGSLYPLMEKLSELPHRLMELLKPLAQRQAPSQDLSTALKDSLQGMETTLSSVLAQAFQQVWQQPRPFESSLQETLQIQVKEQEKQVYYLEKLTAQLPVTMESLVTQLAQKIGQIPRPLLPGSSDGYLQEILEVLKDLQSDLKEVASAKPALQEKSGTGWPPTWWPFGRK